MSSICLSLHVHQPFVLRHYSVFDTDNKYFDGYKSREACRRYAMQSILPANQVLVGLLRAFEGRFRLSCSISGTAIDLFTRYFPEVLDSFRELAETGCVEFLGMPYSNSLALLYSESAFERQVLRHSDLIESVFGQKPGVFRNSELIYGDDLADTVAQLGFTGTLCDGVEDVLGGRSCSRVYCGGSAESPLLLRNQRLTRDVSERFSDRSWDQWPLTAPKFADWLGRFSSPEELVTLVWDYSVFGLQNNYNSGIFDFLRYFPDKVLNKTGLSFITPSEAFTAYPVSDAYRPPHYISSGERNSNLSSWLGNPLQSHAMHNLFSLEERILDSGDQNLYEDWSRLQACEYFEGMSTAPAEIQRLGGWLAPVDSPYDCYINYMNICDSLSSRVGVNVGN